MGNPNQQVNEDPVPDAEPPAPVITDAQVQQRVDAAVAAFAAEHNIEPPAAAPAEAPQTALQALKSLYEAAEHTSFAEKLQTLADRGIQEAELIEEHPVVRALAAVVKELVENA